MQQMLFSDPIRLNAIRYANKEAISFKNKRYTYRQFNARINQLGNALQDLGVKKGDKVAFMLENCNQIYEVAFACGKIGAAFVPVNYRFVGPEIKYVLDNSDSVALFFSNKFASEISSIRDKLETTHHFIVVGESDDKAFLKYEEWISGYPTSEPVPVEPLNELDTICLMYTGGTTGRPKGAVRSHRSLFLLSMIFNIEFAIGRNEKGLVAGPLFGAAAFAISVPNFFVGNSVHILEKFEPEEVLKAIDAEKTTNAFLAPPMFDAIFALPDEVRKKYDVSSMKSLISVGAPLHTDTKERILDFFPNAGLNEIYGASEHGASTNLFPEDQRKKVRSVGIPFFGMEIRLLNDEGRDVQPGEIGEFFVKGLTLCDGYYKNPEATREAFRGEWLGLGDMGRQDEEGYYYIVDRKQDMILSGAINIYPAEIEEVLRHHPKIFDVAVIGVPDENWGEAVMALVILHKGQTATEEEIIQFCEGKMAGYKKPRYVEFVKELPRSPQGKLLKYQIRQKYWKDRDIKIN